MANLIVSTTHNNQAMNESVRAVAAEYFDGRELTEGLLNRIEVAVRPADIAYFRDMQQNLTNCYAFLIHHRSSPFLSIPVLCAAPPK